MAGDSTTIARPYAEAAFEVAREHQALDAWSDALGTLAVIVEDPQIASQVATRTSRVTRFATSSSVSSARA
jgi:F-type H+-transporting ATPase subunit delta